MASLTDEPVPACEGPDAPICASSWASTSFASPTQPNATSYPVARSRGSLTIWPSVACAGIGVM